MNSVNDKAISAAKRAYALAVAAGAGKGVAFDVACAAYRASYPGLQGEALRLAVAEGIALTQEDRLAIESSCAV